jgi:hypothetical protein
MWKKELNVNVELHMTDWKVFLDSFASGNFDRSAFAWTGHNDPCLLIIFWPREIRNRR